MGTQRSNQACGVCWLVVRRRFHSSIDVNVQPQRHFANPADNLKEEARFQAQASQQVEQVLQFVIAQASKCVEHLPPPLQSQSVYPFQVSFSPLDVKGHGSSALLPQGLRSTFSIPY